MPLELELQEAVMLLDMGSGNGTWALYKSYGLSWPPSPLSSLSTDDHFSVSLSYPSSDSADMLTCSSLGLQCPMVSHTAVGWLGLQGDTGLKRQTIVRSL